VPAAIETQTKIAIISKALILCGEPPLNSLSDDRYGATVGANLFELIYENELQANRWRFACGKIALSRLVATPLNQYQYAYQLPPTMLLPLGVYPKQDYEIYSDRIYTNATSFELEYIFKPDITACPAYFTKLLTLALASLMIKPITESDTAQQLMEKKYNAQRAIAQFADAQGRPAKAIVDSPFTDVR
jgi:hypothetical protein